LLYKVFIALKKYRNKIASFTGPQAFCFPYETIFYSPKVLFTSQNQTDDIKNSPIPQLIFQSLYRHHFYKTHLFFTDASKTGPSGYVGVATYSPSLKTQKQLKIDPMASLFTEEALAISLMLDYILDFKVSPVTIFSD